MAKLDFLKIKNQTNTSADLYFYGDIVSDWWGAWQDEDQYPDAIRTFLDGVKDVANLNVYVNSGGGSVFAGLAIYNMLKRHKANKTVYVDGVAASISSVIAMAGDRVIIPSNAFLMIHKPWSASYGNATDFRKMADDLDAIEEGILNVYKENLKEGVDIETIREMVANETWLNGAEAEKYFNIEVAESNGAAACASGYFTNYKKMPKEFNEPPKNKNQELTNDEKVENLLMELDII